VFIAEGLGVFETRDSDLGPPAQFGLCSEGKVVGESGELKWTLLDAVRAAGPPVIRGPPIVECVPNRLCSEPSGKARFFERLASGGLWWMGEASDLEEAEAKLQNVGESNPDSDYLPSMLKNRDPG